MSKPAKDIFVGTYSHKSPKGRGAQLELGQTCDWPFKTAFGVTRFINGLIQAGPPRGSKIFVWSKRKGPFLSPRRRPKPEARRAGHASAQGAALGLPPAPGGGLKGRVRLPFQGKGIVGGRFPRAAPWAEIGRAFGADSTPAVPPRTGWRSGAGGA